MRSCLVLFGLRFYVPVNIYGLLEKVCSPYHTLSWASLAKRLTSTSCTSFSLTDNNPILNQWKVGNDRRNYFTIILDESMGQGPDQNRDPGSAVILTTDSLPSALRGL